MNNNDLYPAETIDAILIDDDRRIHEIWDSFARIGNGHYVGFYSSAEFFNNSNGLNKATPVYIDSDLKENVPGELIAKAIKELGFETIYLQTSESVSGDLSRMDWLTAVIGKDTPWDHLVGLKRADNE